MLENITLWIIVTYNDTHVISKDSIKDLMNSKDDIIMQIDERFYCKSYSNTSWLEIEKIHRQTINNTLLFKRY